MGRTVAMKRWEERPSVSLFRIWISRRWEVVDFFKFRVESSAGCSAVKDDGIVLKLVLSLLAFTCNTGSEEREFGFGSIEFLVCEQDIALPCRFPRAGTS